MKKTGTHFTKIFSICVLLFFYYAISNSAAIVNQVLDELGLQLTDQLTDLPSAYNSIASSATASKTPQMAAAVSDSDADADLQARLNNLRRE